MTFGTTFASLLIHQGEGLAYVRDQMGHRSIQVTVDIYGHLVPDGNRAAVDRLDDLQPAATPAQPEAAATNRSETIAPVESVVSPEGIDQVQARPKAEAAWLILPGEP